MPCASVVLVSGVTDPPSVTTQFTLRPGTPLPLASCTCTTTESVSWNPAGAVCWSPKSFTARVGPPAVAVEVNVTGDPFTESTVAVAVWVPAVSPSLRCTAARPSDPVTPVAALTLPCPAGTTQFTVCPAIGL